ncbi:MAG: hypothetical protein QOI10_1802 [Solirubrobacterales bacterium]|jgi:hypothetical protein|nr:hypothetical protein [Solirubrobacterales bacterium]
MSSATPETSLRLDDRPAVVTPPDRLDLSGLVGSWLNTDRGSSGGVLRFLIEERDGALGVRGVGVGDPEPYEWPEAEAAAFAPTPGDPQAWAFNCRFEFGEMATDVSAYNKQGILVAAIFTSFADGSGRSDYWTREFFHREAQA